LNQCLYCIVDFHLCILLQVLHTIPLDSQEEEVGWFLLTLFFHVLISIAFDIF
jgi:hypothetical protein